MKRIVSLAVALIFSALPAHALAWGSTGHRIVNYVGAGAFPAALPAFVRSAQAVWEIRTLGPEMDRLKGAGRSWDADYDPGHFLDIGDDGTVAGVVRLDALPLDFDAYAKALRAVHADPFRDGYVPYTILDGWEQVRQDFAYWRVDSYEGVHAATHDDRLYFQRDRRLREVLTLRDIGVWGHYIGDGSQPLHITVHYNGWGDYPNPKGYTTSRDTHAFFEGAFVRDHARVSAVRAVLPAYVSAHPAALLSDREMLAKIGSYLSATNATVDRLYDIEKAGGFARGTPTAVAFVDGRLAAGAAEFRDLTALAWVDSLNGVVGYPEVSVRDVLSGSVTLTPKAFGSD